MKPASPSPGGDPADTNALHPPRGYVLARGKIGGLPVKLREEVNRRLHAGEKAAALLPWLNGLPEVRALLERSHRGASISTQNLADYKENALYLDWLAKQEATRQRLAPLTREVSAQALVSSVVHHAVGWRFGEPQEVRGFQVEGIGAMGVFQAGNPTWSLPSRACRRASVSPKRLGSSNAVSNKPNCSRDAPRGGALRPPAAA